MSADVSADPGAWGRGIDERREAWLAQWPTAMPALRQMADAWLAMFPPPANAGYSTSGNEFLYLAEAVYMDAWKRWVEAQPKPASPPRKRTSFRSDAGHVGAAMRWEVFRRDGYACVRCGSLSDLTADHIVPRSRGGPATLDNLQTLCRSCNSTKGIR